MKIYFNGDSHTSGSELRPGEAYSHRLAELYNAEIIGNPAIGGASNDRILRTTERDIESWIQNGNKPDLVVIGWSEFDRIDWFHQGSYKTTNSEELPREECLTIDPNRLYYIEKIVKQDVAISFYTRLYHDKIFNLHQQLHYYGIPHVFFSAVVSFKTSLFDGLHHSLNLETLATGHPTTLFEYDWAGSYYFPYKNNSSFLEWGKQYQYKVTEHYHLEAKAHIDYAVILKDYIDQYILN